MVDVMRTYLAYWLGGAEEGQGIVEYALVLGVLVLILFLAWTFAGLDEAVTGALEAIRDVMDAGAAGVTGDGGTD